LDANVAGVARKPFKKKKWTESALKAGSLVHKYSVISSKPTVLASVRNLHPPLSKHCLAASDFSSIPTMTAGSQVMTTSGLITFMTAAARKRLNQDTASAGELMIGKTIKVLLDNAASMFKLLAFVGRRGTSSSRRCIT
jgi:hypothetical protein